MESFFYHSNVVSSSTAFFQNCFFSIERKRLSKLKFIDVDFGMLVTDSNFFREEERFPGIRVDLEKCLFFNFLQKNLAIFLQILYVAKTLLSFINF